MYDNVNMISIRISANRLVTVNPPEGDPAGHSHGLLVHQAVSIPGVV